MAGGQVNRLYTNNGTATPFTGVAGVDISPDINKTLAVAVGDVNGNGHLDVVVGNNAEPIRVYTNNGTATPFSGVVGLDVSTDANPARAIALGDMNGNGWLDIIAGNIGAVNRLYTNNVTATPFVGVQGVDVGPMDTDETYGVALGDINNDGRLDLVVANYNTLGGGQINRIYLNNGTVQPFVGVRGIELTPDAHVSAAVGLADFNGNGRLDIAIANESAANILYFNNGVADPFACLALVSDITADEGHSFAVAVGDVTGNGHLDVVVGNYDQVNVLYTNNGTTTPFAGVTGVNISDDDHGTWAIALGDVTGNGHLDVVTGNKSGQTSMLYTNNGTATPFDGVEGLPISADTFTTRAIALGDLNGNGLLDVVTGNTGVGVRIRMYINNGTADPYTVGHDISLDELNTVAIALGDVNRNGRLDIVAGNPGAVNRLYLNDGTTPTPNFDGYDITDEIWETYAIALGDMTGNGYLDVIAGNNSEMNRLYTNNGTATPFVDVAGISITDDEHATRSLALVDIDGDGDLDLVVGNNNDKNRLYLNNGTANPFDGVVGVNLLTDERDMGAVAAGDFNRDGAPDIVVVNFNATTRLYLNPGRERRTDYGYIRAAISYDDDESMCVAFGDVNGNGLIDLVVGNYGARNRLYLNNGTAMPFAGVVGMDISTDEHVTYSIALADVNGNGLLDVVAGNFNQVNRLYLNNGTADPFDAVVAVDISDDVQNTYAVALGDFTGNGRLDVAAGNSHQVNRIYTNNGTATPFAGVAALPISLDAHTTFSLAAGDVNGDGHLDIVAGNSTTNRLYLGQGGSTPFDGVQGLDITTDNVSTWGILLDDVNANGRLDVVAINPGQRNRLYLNNGSPDPFAGVTGLDITSNEYDHHAGVLADVDRDGNLDLVVVGDGVNHLYLLGLPFDFNRNLAGSLDVSGAGTPVLALHVDLNVIFQPAAKGAYAAALNIANNSATTPYVVNLAGTGVKADQVITFPAIGDQDVNDSVTLSATASSGLPVAFEAAAPGRITGGTTLTFTGTGTVSVTASQSGNAQWNAAPDVTRSFSVTAVTPPAAPTGVSASAGTYDYKVWMTWNAAAGATSYKLYRHTLNDSGTASLLATTTANSHADTTAVAGQTHYYWVKAANAAGVSGFSAGANGWRGVMGPVVAVNGLVGDNVRITAATPLMITVELMNIPAAYLGVEVDYWVAAYAHGGGLWYYLSDTMAWTPFDGALENIRPVYQGSLMNLPPFKVAEGLRLGPGVYNIWFVVDYPMDGILHMTAGAHLLSRVTLTVE